MNYFLSWYSEQYFLENPSLVQEFHLHLSHCKILDVLRDTHWYKVPLDLWCQKVDPRVALWRWVLWGCGIWRMLFLMLFHIQVLLKIFTDIAPTIFDAIHINLVDFDKSMSPDGSKAIDRDKRKVKQDDVIMDGASFLFFHVARYFRFAFCVIEFVV